MMEQEPSEFLSLEVANKWIVELKQLDNALTAKKFSGEKALILEQTHRTGYVAFAEVCCSGVEPHYSRAGLPVTYLA